VNACFLTFTERSYREKDRNGEKRRLKARDSKKSEVAKNN